MLMLSTRSINLATRPLSAVNAIRLSSSSSKIQASAMVYSNYGKPSEVLSIHKHYLPELKPEDVHIRFLAAPINPADCNQVEGVYPIKPPFTNALDSHDPVAVGGNEGVAEIIAAGDQVKSLKVGDKVVMANAGKGTWRTHAALPATDVQLLPGFNQDVSLVHAATITVNPSTAYRMIKDFTPLQQGDFIIQNGANSAVGQSVIQLANAWGFKTINVVRDRPNLDELRQYLTSLGATHVITEDELSKRETRSKLKEWLHGRKLRLALNCVGGKNATELSRYLDHEGKHVTYGAMAKQPMQVPAAPLIFKNISFHGFWVSRWTDSHSAQEREAMLADLIDLIKKKKLKEPIWEKVSWKTNAPEQETLKSFQEAVDKGITGYGKGKQILVFDE
ncbi:hypothetical protein NQZ79_g5807 [Umbelopsis isabellina]|nr:hypothetical protein NQZ79_g5807 [Umbelopsis isabellina]